MQTDTQGSSFKDLDRQYRETEIDEFKDNYKQCIRDTDRQTKFLY